ncbi:MAG: ketopantoate reductase family protein [Proteobacteria bacterium]|nr:ketopantoate reductase family protein [Pseudomonadota bacterium]
MSPATTTAAARPAFVVLGAGAMGSIVAAHLARAGHSVTVLARGERAAHVARHGLALRGLVSFDTPVAVVTDPSLVRQAGTLIVAMKTPGTQEALQQLRHVEFAMTLSIQNGPLKNELLSQVFGAPRVLGALANTSGELLSDGTVLFTRNVNILVGELDGSSSARALDFATTLDSAGVRASATTEILSLEWSKFCGWIGLMVLSVTTRVPTWQYLLDPDAALLLAGLVRETGALAQAQGITLSDQSILPAASMCAGTEAEAARIVMHEGHELKARAPGHRLSSLQDLDAGRPLEVHETLGYAVQRGRSLGLRLPLLETFLPLVAAVDRTRRQQGDAMLRAPAPPASA